MDNTFAGLGAQPLQLRVPHGTGKIFWSDPLKSSFDGEFVLGEPRGRGTFRNDNGELRGCFGDGGLVSGPGSRIWRGSGLKDDGISGLVQGMLFQHCNEGEEMRYTGQLRDNMMHGPGTLEWPNGQIYQGNFVANCIEGEGIMRWPNKVESTEGRKNGHSAEMNVYTGHFVAGVFHGKGELCLTNGDSIGLLLERCLSWSRRVQFYGYM